jgi:hypothetical protein
MAQAMVERKVAQWACWKAAQMEKHWADSRVVLKVGHLAVKWAAMWARSWVDYWAVKMAVMKVVY